MVCECVCVCVSMWKANWSLASTQVLQIMQAGKMLCFPFNTFYHHFTTVMQLMWCGRFLCGLWWDVHLLITGITPCCISATYKETRSCDAGYILLDVSSMKLQTHVLLFFLVNVVWACVALLSSSLLEKALNATVVILCEFLCQDLD